MKLVEDFSHKKHNIYYLKLEDNLFLPAYSRGFYKNSEYNSIYEGSKLGWTLNFRNKNINIFNNDED